MGLGLPGSGFLKKDEPGGTEIFENGSRGSVWANDRCNLLNSYVFPLILGLSGPPPTARFEVLGGWGSHYPLFSTAVYPAKGCT